MVLFRARTSKPKPAANQPPHVVQKNPVDDDRRQPDDEERNNWTNNNEIHNIRGQIAHDRNHIQNHNLNYGFNDEIDDFSDTDREDYMNADEFVREHEYTDVVIG